MSRSTFLVLFFLLTLFDLAVIWFDLDYRGISKPLIVISLMCYYAWCMKDKWKPVDALFMGAMAFALGGDVLLLWDDLFVYGLGSFLVMQVLYVLVFLRDKNYYGRREGLYAFVLLLIAGLVITHLWPNLGDMAVPVIIYSLAISLMSWVAYTRDMTRAGYSLIWVGTMFFIVSDMSIAIQNFGGYALPKLTVMSTYAIAQVLIVLGFISYRQS